MLCTVTVRRLRPGTYEAFREAVKPVRWPDGLTRVSVLRSQENPDEVATIGYLDMSPQHLEELRDSPEFVMSEAERLERVAEFADTVIVNGVFELADELRPPA